MDFRNRLGLYGAYFLGIAGIGFTLPYLAVFLGERGLSDRTIGIVSTLAALAGLVQFPCGLWSDRLGRRKPFLIVALAVLAVSTGLLQWVEGAVLGTFVVMLAAENGACRATVESLAGAEAAHLAGSDGVGAALGALRFWKPISIVLVALVGGWIAETWGVSAILIPLTVVQALAVAVAFLIHEGRPDPAAAKATTSLDDFGFRDRTLWIFVVAMILFHVANAPGGLYLALFMNRDLGAAHSMLAYAFIVSMIAWMLVVRPVGRLSDHIGRKPLLIVGWFAISLRMALDAIATDPWQVLAIQALDGFGNGIFAVIAASWMTDRLNDPRRVGTAQTLVGSSLVLGSAIGPLLAALVVDTIGYRGLFAILAGVGLAATALIWIAIPETLTAQTARTAQTASPESAEAAAIP